MPKSAAMFPGDQVLRPCRHCKKDTPVKWRWHGQVKCTSCGRTFWDSTQDDWETKLVLERYIRNQQGLRASFFALTAISAAWVPTLAFLGNEKNVIFWFVGLSAATLALATWVKRTVGSNNLLTGRFEYLQFLMGTIVGSSTLFACMQLYRQHVVERADEHSTIADIEAIIEKLQSLAFLKEWSGTIGYASLVVAFLILLGLLPSSLSKKLPKYLKFAGKTLTKSAAVIAALGMFVFAGSIHDRNVYASQVALKAKVKDLEQRFDSNVKQAQKQIEDLVADEVANQLALNVAAIVRSAPILDVTDIDRPDPPLPPDSAPWSPSPGPTSPTNPLPPEDRPSEANFERVAVGRVVSARESEARAILARYRQDVWSNSVALVKEDSLKRAIGVSGAFQTLVPVEEPAVADAKAEIRANVSAASLTGAEQSLESATSKPPKRFGEDGAVREIVGTVVKHAMKGLPKPISAGFSEGFGGRPEAKYFAEMFEGLTDDIVVEPAKDVVKELLVAAIHDLKEVRGKKEPVGWSRRERVQQAVRTAFSKSQVVVHLQRIAFGAASALTAIRDAFVRGQWSSSLFEALSAKYFSDRSRDLLNPRSTCWSSGVREQVSNLRTRISSIPAGGDLERAQVLNDLKRVSCPPKPVPDYSALERRLDQIVELLNRRSLGLAEEQKLLKEAEEVMGALREDQSDPIGICETLLNNVVVSRRATRKSACK
jgi:hypothetical protein